MKKLLSAIFMLITLSVYAQDKQHMDEEYGFRGNKFGTPIASFKNMVFLTGYGENKVFQKRDETFQWENATLVKITYEFYKGKFYKVNIEAKGNDNSKAILNWLIAHYGPGVKGDARTERHTWTGDKMMVTYKETPLTHDASIVISAKDIESRIEKDRDNSPE